jgi:ankyrin repeat protein
VRVVHEKWTDKGIFSANRPFMDNGVNMGGATPYLLAAQAADVEAMRLLHALGSDPRAVTSAGNTAVMLAAGVGYVEGSRRYRPERDALEAVKLAVAAGVDVNATNANGQTALHGAVYRAANTIIGQLVHAGARTDVSDELDRTPLKLAEQGFNQVASLIRRDSAAALLRELSATPASAAAPQARDAR